MKTIILNKACGILFFINLFPTKLSSLRIIFTFRSTVIIDMIYLVN